MRPSNKVQRNRRANLALLSAFLCSGFIATPGFTWQKNTLLIAQQGAPQQAPYQAPYQSPAPQYQNAPPMQWQGQTPQSAPAAQWTSQPPPQNGQWGPPQGSMGQVAPMGQAAPIGQVAPPGVPNYSNGYPGGMQQQPQQWQGAPQQSMQAPQAFGQQSGYPQSVPPANFGAPPTGNTGYGAPPQYQQPQEQNWNYQNQNQQNMQPNLQPNLQGQAQQYGNYAPSQVQNSVPSPPSNEGYPSVEELNETFQQNPAKNVQQPSTAEKVGTGLLNMVKNSMMTPSYGMGGMGMNGYGMGGYPMGGMGMPMGGYGMPYGAAPMGYPMMGSPSMLGAPMGGSMMNNILNNGLRNLRF
ncbi:MAG: hypothetical protein DKT66_17720 [Candidatus Melainabacteria bacterium]|nr:MAG: hypothetical protein DKT66_17720 [Candidatus Melainabacteria bacterium]